MDKFVTVKKPSTALASGKQDGKAERPKLRYNPYGVRRTEERKLDQWKDKKRTERILANLTKDGQTKPSSSALTNHLLSTLGEESNPITHSDIYQRSDHIVSAASGHQRSDGRGHHSTYLEVRSEKLAAQLPQEASSQVLRNVRVYINGYLEDTTDIEMKRIVALAGGQVQRTASGATHILTSQQLNGSKTHKHLTSKMKSVVHVVRPEWVTDCIAAGKRLSERNYAVIQNASAAKITDMFQTGGSGSGKSDS